MAWKGAQMSLPTGPGRPSKSDLAGCKMISGTRLGMEQTGEEKPMGESKRTSSSHQACTTTASISLTSESATWVVDYLQFQEAKKPFIGHQHFKCWYLTQI